jgi:hypothetical protein
VLVSGDEQDGDGRGGDAGDKEKDPPKVVIFGAGITGLTVAHELVERGWEVTVVEPEIDPLNVEECAIGGLAKTQWSVYQARYKNDKGPTEALPLVPTVRLRFQASPGQALPFFSNVTKPLPKDDPSLAKARAAIELSVGGGWASALRGALDVGSQIYLDRVEARLRNIQPKAPHMVVSWGAKVDPDLATVVAVYLLDRGVPGVSLSSKEDDFLPPGVVQIETDLRDRRDDSTHPGAQSSVLPGEHGFRFFPALYRHLFDTLRRIPVRAEGQNFGDAFRSVYDNLIPTESNWMALDDVNRRPDSKTARERGVARFPRRLRKSLRESFDALNDMYTELGYTMRDVELLKLRLFKYMTSCRDRRREEYQQISWSNFMGLSDLCDAAEHDMDVAPQVLAAMTAKESDARTQGNLATQLLLDPINADERVDSTLNAPSTVAWFAPWKDYLLSQGVRFVPGKLVGFARDGYDVRPTVDIDGHDGRTPNYVDDAHYYVLAVPIQALIGKSRDEFGSSLTAKWQTALEGCGADDDEISSLARWAQCHVYQKPLYKGLTGIQFYFDSDAMARSGHTLFMDSPWRLSAISQASFWHRRRELFDGYRGIVSIDVGSIDEPPHGREYDWLDGTVLSFIQTKRDQVHRVVWDQTTRSGSYGISLESQKKSGRQTYPYRVYRIDEYVQYDEQGMFVANGAPFLINGVEEWEHRPGWDVEKEDGKLNEPESGPAEARSKARYRFLPKFRDGREGACKWVLAGTFMQTWTRATTMESANESARHAVNTLIDDAADRFSWPGQLCRIWNPEEYEHPDLKIWQELDRKLYRWDAEPLPHMIDILELDAIPDTLLEKGEMRAIIDRLVAQRGGEK